MAFFGYLIIAVARILGLLINMYTFVVAAAVILSWVRPDPYNPLVRTIYQITQPLFTRARRLLPDALMRTGIDFAPMLVIFALVLIDTVIVNLLHDFGRQLLQLP